MQCNGQWSPTKMAVLLLYVLHPGRPLWRAQTIEHQSPIRPLMFRPYEFAAAWVSLECNRNYQLPPAIVIVSLHPCQDGCSTGIAEDSVPHCVYLILGNSQLSSGNYLSRLSSKTLHLHCSIYRLPGGLLDWQGTYLMMVQVLLDL